MKHATVNINKTVTNEVNVHGNSRAPSLAVVAIKVKRNLVKVRYVLFNLVEIEDICFQNIFAVKVTLYQENYTSGLR